MLMRAHGVWAERMGLGGVDPPHGGLAFLFPDAIPAGHLAKETKAFAHCAHTSEVTCRDELPAGKLQ